MLRAYVPQIPYGHVPILAKVLLKHGDELCALEDWSYKGPFCDDLIVALAQQLLGRLPPPFGPTELIKEILAGESAMAIIAAFYMKERDRPRGESVFDQDGMNWLEQELRNRLSSAIHVSSVPLYPLLVASEALDTRRPNDFTQWVQSLTWAGDPYSCDQLLRLFHGAGAVDGERMQARIRKVRTWLRSSMPGGSVFYDCSERLAQPPDWLDERRRRALERIIEADALTPWATEQAD
jgi:hypothetical protein